MTLAPVIDRNNYQAYLEFEDFKVLQGNIVKKTDTYNLSHQDAKCNTDWEISHIYNRKRGIILYGFNKLVGELLSVRITMKMVTSAYAHAIRQGVPFPYELFKRIVEELDGRIPILIEALPDGRWCPKGTPFAQIRNTVEGFGELVTWFEGVLLKMAFPSGCMTRAFLMKKYLEKKQIEQGAQDNPLFLWRFHSFGYRGHNSEEGAYWAGTAWTTYLPGTDDFHVSWYTKRAVMGSIRALAHKVTQQFNKMSAEEALATYGIDKALPGDVVAMYHMITQASLDPNPATRVAALVIDTYDAMKVINHHVVDIARYAESKGVHGVFRPDSGDCLEQGIMIYWKLKNAGLDHTCHVIIGEGMSFEQAQKYDEQLEREGIPLSWFFYGIGGGFYKDIDRDWSGAAMKTAYSNGADRMKLVLTAPEKSSIPGAVQLVMMGGMLTIVPEDVAKENKWKSEYEVIYDYNNGDVIQVIRDLDDIMDVANQQTGEQGRIAMSKEILEKIEDFRQMILEEDDVA